MRVRLTVVLSTYNPDALRLDRTLNALGRQTLTAKEWELVVVDNASTPAVTIDPARFKNQLRILREPTLGLSSARRTGFRSAHGELVVLVDDDNVLAPDYLENVLEAFARLPHVGVLGGKSLPEFESPPGIWLQEFFPLLALRDFGESEQVVIPATTPSGITAYPDCAPIGAGMALRVIALAKWLAAAPSLPDRTGNLLTSGGDNDLVLSALEAGWGAAYIPTLHLTHLIPDSRIQPAYLCRLNRAVQKSWMQVLTLHGANPWPPIPRSTVPLRKLKAWFQHRAWQNDVARIRWSGACGHAEGRAS